MNWNRNTCNSQNKFLFGLFVIKSRHFSSFVSHWSYGQRKNGREQRSTDFSFQQQLAKPSVANVDKLRFTCPERMALLDYSYVLTTNLVLRDSSLFQRNLARIHIYTLLVCGPFFTTFHRALIHLSNNWKFNEICYITLITVFSCFHLVCYSDLFLIF